MNEKKPTWNCPVCDQFVPYDDLIIDSLFVEILAKAKDLDEVQFTADAEWTKVSNEKGSSSSSHAQTSKTNKECNSSFSIDDNNNAASANIKMDEDVLVDLIG